MNSAVLLQKFYCPSGVFDKLLSNIQLVLINICETLELFFWYHHISMDWCHQKCKKLKKLIFGQKLTTIDANNPKNNFKVSQTI